MTSRKSRIGFPETHRMMMRGARSVFGSSIMRT